MAIDVDISYQALAVIDAGHAILPVTQEAASSSLVIPAIFTLHLDPGPFASRESTFPSTNCTESAAKCSDRMEDIQGRARGGSAHGPSNHAAFTCSLKPSEPNAIPGAGMPALRNPRHRTAKDTFPGGGHDPEVRAIRPYEEPLLYRERPDSLLHDLPQPA